MAVQLHAIASIKLLSPSGAHSVPLLLNGLLGSRLKRLTFKCALNRLNRHVLLDVLVKWIRGGDLLVEWFNDINTRQEGCM